MLGHPQSVHAAPNKLIKRSRLNGPASGSQRRGSQALTLRRPATSHQRAATLQLMQQQIQQTQQNATVLEPISPDPKLSLDMSVLSPTSPIYAEPKRASGKWASFFHARRSSSLNRDLSGLPSAAIHYHHMMFPRKKLSIPFGRVVRAYLTKPDQLGDIPPLTYESDPAQEKSAQEEQRTSTPDLFVSDEPAPDERPKRSLSMHFLSRPSIRRRRRSTIGAKNGHARYLSDPGTALQSTIQNPVGQESDSTREPTAALQGPETGVPTSLELPLSRRRNSSSPLPPLNRLSTFSIDLSKIGEATLISVDGSRRIPTPINYARGPQTPSSLAHSRGPSGQQSLTLAGSDFDSRGTFGDEDTDLRSDGMYDSFRTGASSSRMRSVETPIESMFDESPPSSACHCRTKRLSVQEMLGPSWDGETKIIEEDETLPMANGVSYQSMGPNSNNSLSLVTHDLGRLSFDDENDDDWARDDDNTLSNHLSPPGSANSRRIPFPLRQALKSTNGGENLAPPRESIDSRPRSSIFDWSEPSVHDKYDTDTPRPKTVHGKQELDLRGGRPTTRKPPGAAHVRSQSVPVVPDLVDSSKPQPRFGTWGLGTKTVSEDWDDDFEFEGDDLATSTIAGKDSATSFSVVVPASIQATQPSVRAHSGQIRELSLLVNDLKRLCRHGKELDILNGPAAAKFSEAESIIVLASPDEEEPKPASPSKSSREFDRSDVDDRFLDEGFDGPVLDNSDDSFDFPDFPDLDIEMSKTAVVRERPGVRRRSVFSPEDDIFGGNWPLNDGNASSSSPRPRTPSRTSTPNRTSAVVSAVIEVLQQQQRAGKLDNSKASPFKSTPTTPTTKLFFDTNSLQELVKRASQLRDALSEVVRKAELLTQSPVSTPRRSERSSSQGRNLDGSPAFTSVFDNHPSTGSSPQTRLPNSQSGSTILSKASVDAMRMPMMTVN